MRLDKEINNPNNLNQQSAAFFFTTKWCFSSRCLKPRHSLKNWSAFVKYVKQRLYTCKMLPLCTGTRNLAPSAGLLETASWRVRAQLKSCPCPTLSLLLPFPSICCSSWEENLHQMFVLVCAHYGRCAYLGVSNWSKFQLDQITLDSQI